jgi:hypothetical protein
MSALDKPIIDLARFASKRGYYFGLRVVSDLLRRP